ncbi:MAG: LysR family transcriptional regulator [Sandaracinus sp.]|nr:LysR family transcriptional regulator [Sandaracinus sp.]MCB9621495.1 LysR family transcriptional regulator [Sandaracinus sp.]
MDRIDELETWLAIVDGGSLAEAARKLGRSPPAVTRALAALEERVGTRLLDRTTRRAIPTDAGLRLAEQARRLLGELDDALHEAAEDAAPTGLLRVSAPRVFGARHVAPVAFGFLDAFPRVRVDLSLDDRVVDLLDERIDVGVRVGELPPSTIVARRVGYVSRVVLASPSYLARRGEPASPEELVDHEVVHFASMGGEPTRWRFRDDTRVSVVPRLVVDHAELAVEAAREGRGLVTAFCYQVEDELEAGHLRRVLVSHEPPPVPVHLVRVGGRFAPRRVRAFVDFAAPALETVLARVGAVVARTGGIPRA